MPNTQFPLLVAPTLPEPLRRLADLAQNFLFSWYPSTGQLFRKLDSVLWRKVESSLANTSPARSLHESARSETVKSRTVRPAFQGIRPGVCGWWWFARFGSV